MDQLFDWTARISVWLAVLAKLILALIVLLVTADVLARNVARPMAWSASLTEYLLIYATFLPMPALVRSKGHVCADFLRTALPLPVQRVAERFVYVLCAALCAYLGYFAATSLAEAVRTGAYEIRSFDMPKWLIFLPMVVGLWLSAIEFLRFLMGADSFYTADASTREGF